MGWGWEEHFPGADSAFAPFANKLASCPGGAALKPWCIGLAAHLKNEKTQLAYSSSINRLVHQTRGNHDLPITTSEESELLAKAFLTFKI